MLPTMAQRSFARRRAAAAPGGGGASIIDTFDRADGSLNGSTTSDGNATWTASGMSVSSNRVVGGGGAWNYGYVATGWSDVDIALTFPVAAASFARLTAFFFRATDGDNGLHVQCRAISGGTTFAIDLQKREAGVFSTIRSAATVTGSGAGSRVRVNAVGSSISVYHTPSGGSESLIWTTTSTFNQTATNHGLGVTFGTTAADDLAITPAT